MDLELRGSDLVSGRNTDSLALTAGSSWNRLECV